MAATITTPSRTIRTPATCRRGNRLPEPAARGRSFTVALLLLLAAAAAGPRAAFAQGPSAPWRTLATAHFRVHFPAPFAAWAERAAGWLEGVRARAIAEIGFTPADTVEVVVSDPEADANGAALPLRGWPRLVLWTTPPPADSEIGFYRDWTEDLLTHEEAHLVHLLRPSRNPLLSSVLPVGPIALAPRWVVEGYATLVEGRLTGAGRPNGDVRAAVLRRWAQGGKLPGYARLAADAHAWRGMSMAYLLGSAYLEWLEQRAGPGSLRKLWARMTARAGRGFDEAFAGIWGNTPESLYDRFRAELTWRAMEAEKRVQAVGPLAVREGALWQSLTWTTGAPAVSPDGSQLALVRHDRERPAQLVIWPTAPDAAAEKRWQETQDRQQARDPQDVPAVRARPLPRKPLYTWTATDGGDPVAPRFLPGGTSLLLERFLPDAEGFLHPDLFEWRPAAGEMRRITRQADLRDADPAPGGGWAVAVRDRFGLSQLVTVELASGEVRPLTEPSLERVYDRPRVSPDGSRVAFGLHSGGGWRLAVLELAPDRRAAGGETELLAPPGGAASSPAWSPDGRTLYSVVGRGGFIDLYAFAAPAAGAAEGDASPVGADVGAAAAAGVTVVAPPPRALTRTQGGAFAPAPTPDGTGLFYLSLEPDGLDVRRLDLTVEHPPLAEVVAPSDLAPAVRPAPPALPLPAPRPMLPMPPAVRAAPDAAPTPLLPPAIPPAEAGSAPAAASPRPLGSPTAEVGPVTAPAPSSLVGGTSSDAGRLTGGRSPYGAGRQELLPLIGGDAGSSGGTFELGARAGDLIGRLDTLALGALGSSGAPRGGALVATWRGWPVDVGLHLFDVRESPSRQAGPGTPPAAIALDLERRGLEASAEWKRQGAGERFRLRASLLWQRLSEAAAERLPVGSSGASSLPTAGRAAGEGVAFVESGYRVARRLGLWRLGADAGARLAAGHVDGSSWSRFSGDAALSIRRKDTGLELAWRRDGSRQAARAFDQYQLGSPAGSLLPPAALAARIVSPALPAATLVGAEHEEERAELDIGLGGVAGFGGFVPLPLFYERHRLWGGLLPHPAEVTLAGLEYRIATAPIPLVRLPAAELRLGVARLLSGPLRDRTRWWLATVYRP